MYMLKVLFLSSTIESYRHVTMGSKTPGYVDYMLQLLPFNGFIIPYVSSSVKASGAFLTLPYHWKALVIFPHIDAGNLDVDL